MATIGFEEELWASADKLRNNMDAAEYKHVVLGLIFLKYVSDTFMEKYKELLEEDEDFAEDMDAYLAEGVFWVPEIARWDYIAKHSKQAEIGQIVDSALDAIEKENDSLRGVLPKNYSRPELDKRILGEIIDLFTNINVGGKEGKEKDILGRVYEYFLGKFAANEGKGGGEFYTPKSIVSLMVEMIQPFKGYVYDPACGSGNFLTETYISLRRLENEALRILSHGQISFGDADWNPIQVSIGQFYGIEINDFAVTVAKTALWIAESQMMKETEDVVHMSLNFLPLKSYTNITEGNALEINWEDIIHKYQLSYIMGNPPFVGASMMTKQQKEQAVSIYGKIKLSNSIDYVGAWYHKAAAYIDGTTIRVSFVSTNSITQGEQVAPLWDKLVNRYGLHIDFAYRTFKWNSEASEKAAVHCVIIGFSQYINHNKRKLYLDDSRMILVENINPYLLNAPDVLVSSRSKPICDVPKMLLGNKPADGGNLILSSEERDEIIKREPNLEPYIHPYIGAVEYINNKIRYCFWLVGVSPSTIKNSPELKKRLEAVREMRLNSSAAPTREKADTPGLFFFISQPSTSYLLVPSTSSENRRYFRSDKEKHLGGKCMKKKVLAALMCAAMTVGMLAGCGGNSTAGNHSWSGRM